MRVAEMVTSTPGIHPLAPAEKERLPGRTILFRWDAQHLTKRPTHYRLTIKRVGPDQSAAQAFARNDAVVTTTIDHVPFYVLNAQHLGERGVFVWQVTSASDERAASPIRTFHTTLSPLAGLGVTPSQSPLRPTRLRGDNARNGPRGSACPNGGFEMGNFQGWQALHGTRAGASTVDLSTLQPGFAGGGHDIRSTSQGNDLWTGLPQVYEGKHSVRLGSLTGGSAAYFLAYTFTVTSQNRDFGFRFAALLDNPGDGHDLNEMPFFSYYIVRGSSWAFTMNNLPVAGRSWVAGHPDPLLRHLADKVYTPWSPICNDLSQYEGETMTIVFAVAGCAQGGHGGYVYIDDVCGDNLAEPRFTLPDRACKSSAIGADATATTGETSHYWSMEESDVQGSRNPATEIGHWWVGQQVGYIDLRAYYLAKTGQQLKCNTYYRVKLAVINECTPWREVVRLLYVTCPPLTAGPSLCVPCHRTGKGAKLGVGNVATPGTKYQWTPAAGLDDPTSPTPTHAHGSVTYPFTYSVTAVDASGCSNTDSVTLYCKKPAVELTQKADCCKTTLHAAISGADRVQWSNGQTDVTSIQVGEGTHSVTASNPCGSTTKTIYVAAGGSSFVGPVHTVEVATRMVQTPIAGMPHSNKMLVVDVTCPIGTPNAYNATRFKLTIWGRFADGNGNPIRTITGESCTGFTNGSIFWDGKYDDGTYVQQQGLYAWRLYFGNCQYEGLWPAKVRHRIPKQVCVEWHMLFGKKLWCKAWGADMSNYEDTYVSGNVFWEPDGF